MILIDAHSNQELMDQFLRLDFSTHHHLRFNTQEAVFEIGIPKPSAHFVSASCIGERCGPCLRRYKGSTTPVATHKVGEEIAADDPHPHRHNLTQYLCCACYVALMGPAAERQCCGIAAIETA